MSSTTILNLFGTYFREPRYDVLMTTPTPDPKPELARAINACVEANYPSLREAARQIKVDRTVLGKLVTR